MAPELGENDLELFRRWHRLSRPYIAWQFEQFAKFVGERVADVGCGLGNFVPHLRDRELYLGLEPDNRLAAEARGQFLDWGNVLIIGGREADVTSPECVALMRSHRVDTVLAVNVLEHIADDRHALQNMVATLDPGKHLCLLVPALPWAMGSLDRIALHHRRYSRAELLRLAVGLPAEVLCCHYLNLVGGLGWWLRSRVLRSRKYGGINFILMNALLPGVRLVERVVKPPLGLSLVMVLRKI